jgi:2-polyprenyl-3-methyl-5-hydroxy-6-metoxy-1,4-benzoquinol methylase
VRNRALTSMATIDGVVSSCPLCGGENLHPYKFGLVQCATCAIVLSPAIWQPQANEAMEEEWFGQDDRVMSSLWTGLFETWNNRRTLRRVKAGFGSGHLLEIGVGSGSFLNAARAHGYEVVGCDLSASICERVHATYGVRMHCEPVAALAGESCFDVIVINHVLEHVNQPIDLLKHIRRLLAPGGVVHIAVPNVSCWQASLSGWASYEPYHLSYFDPRTLTRVVTASGLKVSRILTHDSFSGWFLAILRTGLGVNNDGGAVARHSSLSSKRTASRLGVYEHAYRLAMVCSGAATWPLRVIQARLGRGDEAICIAYKPQKALQA